MEELLNKLIEKGWKPRGWNWTPNTYWVEGNSICWNRGGKKCIRELVAKESGLRQFVCNNELQKTTDGEYERWLKKASDCRGDSDEYDTKHDSGYEYRLIESALKDESELESFILDNIKA